MGCSDSVSEWHVNCLAVAATAIVCQLRDSCVVWGDAATSGVHHYTHTTQYEVPQRLIMISWVPEWTRAVRSIVVALFRYFCRTSSQRNTYRVLTTESDVATNKTKRVLNQFCDVVLSAAWATTNCSRFAFESIGSALSSWLVAISLFITTWSIVESIGQSMRRNQSSNQKLGMGLLA